MTRLRSAPRQRRAPARPKDGPGISHGDIADHNSRTLLELLRLCGPLTRRDMALRLGLTEPAITGILRRLEDGRLVSARRQSNASRYPSTEFMIEPNGAVSLGIRLLPARAEAVLINLAGETLASRTDLHPKTAAAAALSMARERKPADARLIGVGLAGAPSQAPDTAGLAAALAPLPVVVAPDTAAAVTAERMLGHGERDGSLVSLILAEDGVRAGLSIGGRPFSGHHGFAGSIGAMHTGRDRANLSARVSLAELAGLIAGSATGAAPSGPAAAWAEDAASHLLDAVIAISGLIAPGILVVGGDLPDEIVDLIIDNMARECLDKAKRLAAPPWMPPIVASHLPAAGICTGAALLPLLEYLLPNPQLPRDIPSAQAVSAPTSG